MPNHFAGIYTYNPEVFWRAMVWRTSTRPQFDSAIERRIADNSTWVHCSMLSNIIRTIARTVLPPKIRIWAKRRLQNTVISLTGPDARSVLSSLFIRGIGLEIGALHEPLPVPKGASVRYLDRLTAAEARALIPEVRGLPLVEPDIIGDAESLDMIPERSQDFVIANHFLEHAQDPIRTLENIVRILKPNAVLFLGLPDKHLTFDVDRPETEFEHVLRDYQQGPTWSLRQHIEEWVRLVNRVSEPKEVEKQVKHLIGIDAKIHFHVWAMRSATDFLTRTFELLGVSYETLALVQNSHGKELLFVLRIRPDRQVSQASNSNFKSA